MFRILLIKSLLFLPIADDGAITCGSKEVKETLIRIAFKNLR